MQAGAGNASEEWGRHWPVVAAAASGVALSTLSSFSTGVFLEPMQTDLGWSRAQITSAHAIAATSAVLFGPVVGGMIDRVGPRKIAIIACLAIVTTVAMLSLTTSNIWVWRALWIPLSVAIVLIQPTVWTSAITRLFTAGRGFALAITLCGSSVASLITPPLGVWLIATYGWRMAWLLLPLIWGGTVIPLVILLFKMPPTTDTNRHGPAGTSFRRTASAVIRNIVFTGRFATLALAGLCFALVAVTLAVSVVPVLDSFGLTRAEAARTASLLGLASIAGRISIGYLLDRWTARYIAAASACLPIAGIALLLGMPVTLTTASAAIMIFGLTLGAELDILAYLTSHYCPRENFGFMFGVVGGLVTLAGGTGPVMLNAVFDHTGSYRAALLGGVPLCILAASLFLMLGPVRTARPTAHFGSH